MCIVAWSSAVCGCIRWEHATITYNLSRGFLSNNIHLVRYRCHRGLPVIALVYSRRFDATCRNFSRRNPRAVIHLRCCTFRERSVAAVRLLTTPPPLSRGAHSTTFLQAAVTHNLSRYLRRTFRGLLCRRRRRFKYRRNGVVRQARFPIALKNAALVLPRPRSQNEMRLEMPLAHLVAACQ